MARSAGSRGPSRGAPEGPPGPERPPDRERPPGPERRAALRELPSVEELAGSLGCVPQRVAVTAAREAIEELPWAILGSASAGDAAPAADTLPSVEPPLVGRAREGRLLLDPRTLTDAEAEQAARAAAAALA